MLRLLRSTKAKLLCSSSSSSSLSRTLSRPTQHLPHTHIGSLSPLSDLFHRNTATLPHPIPIQNASPPHFNATNSSRYKASGLDTNLQAGARHVPRVWAFQSPMLLGVNSVMDRSFERVMEAGTLGMTGHKRFMSDTPSKISETNPLNFQ